LRWAVRAVWLTSVNQRQRTVEFLNMLVTAEVGRTAFKSKEILSSLIWRIEFVD
jgi:hypothetical protein